MEPTMINQKRQGMETFLSELKSREEQEKLMHQYKQNPSYKLSRIEDERKKGLENCASGVLCKIYRDALPIEDEYKSGYMNELDDGFVQFIKGKNSDGVYAFMSSCSLKGSKPAKLMVEAVEEAVNNVCSKFYENLEELDPDEIDLGPDSKEIQDGIEQVTSKMDYDEISSIIEQNVQNTVRNEIETQKAEDMKLQQLQEKLSEDETVQTEDAIDAALMREGMEKRIYQPTLFNGIMIGKVKEFTEDGNLDEEHVQKKAFFESVKEYTKLETLATFNMMSSRISDINSLARQYAVGDI